ncbi:MAG: PAS domain S-box protein [Proteobacteria bacterium]|nr:PAS domain S-box protein [Pseudomonadota bacterium]
MDPGQSQTFDAAQLPRAIVEQTPEAVIFADRDGAIRLWNHGAETLFGHGAGDAIGQSLDIIIPEHLRRAHWQGFDHAIQTGEARHPGEVRTTRSMHKDGRKLYVDLTFTLIRSGDGTVIGALSIGRDCTERHLADVALRKRIAELEARQKSPTSDGDRNPR